jgi:hypothetical protein
MAGFSDWTPPSVSTVSVPALPALTLSDDEKRTLSHLSMFASGDERRNMELTNAYFMGAQVIDNLGIAVPKEIADKLRTLVGWGRMPVDPYVERLAVEGVRLPGATDVDPDLADVWAENGLDAEQSLAFTDALALGRAWWMVGSGESPDDAPRITVESPLNVAVKWDVTGRRVMAAMHTYLDGMERRASLMLPNRTIHLATEKGVWVISEKPDEHSFGYVPMVRMANNPRTDNRNGYSEITPELQSIIDGACRTLLGLEVARELYSVPQKLLLGASESDFQNPNGQVRKAWDTYINHILALERDEEGNLPEVKQMTAYDPGTFTKLIEMYASQAAGILAAPPQDLGLYTQGNPVSADAYEATETRRNRRAVRKQAQFGVALVEVMQMAMRFQNNGDLPAKFKRMAIDWQSVHLAPPLNADAIQKMVSEDILPKHSDVTLKRLGINPTERAQLTIDRGEQVQSSIVDALNAAAVTARQQPAAPSQVTGDAGVQS